MVGMSISAQFARGSTAPDLPLFNPPASSLRWCPDRTPSGKQFHAIAPSHALPSQPARSTREWPLDGNSPKENSCGEHPPVEAPPFFPLGAQPPPHRSEE